MRDSGEVMIKQIRPPSGVGSFAARTEALTDKPASKIFHEKREQGGQERDGQFSETYGGS